MANHHQLVLKNKFVSLMSNYSVEVEAVAGQVRGWPLLCLTDNTCICCFEEIFGVMKWYCLQSPACFQPKLLF